ncbi:hypothetical protein [Nitratiruptor sp. SB155-2]|uniref:hypothetical protein n=1 Tax=Nitratiruptor sp. (strain SB155-2) TaxID=387092 RepID=UPI00059C38F1|nr:hypothetical protein [Nitratiruptor sp. SB155-2]
MIKLAFLLALLFIVGILKIVKEYEGDKRKFLFDIFLLLFLLFVTSFSKYARVYLPLFVTHIVALIFAWGWFYIYLFKKTNRVYPVFLPLLTIAFFFILGEVTSSM